MSETYQTALTLLVVGMITVFSILSLVVFLGQLLIRTVNRFFPELPKNSLQKDDAREITAQEIVVLTAAVHQFTGGKGSITSIRKKQ